MSLPFQLQHLDHVAIRSNDPAKSCNWYEKVLGLKKYQFEKWGEFPIFMLAGKIGVAIFPADLDAIVGEAKSRRIDHFAFNVNNKDFELAKAHYTQLGIDFYVQDHHYFHSIYTKDPDGHTVELTTLVVTEAEVYG